LASYWLVSGPHSASTHAITEPFSHFQEFFLMMEFSLSRSLSHTLFTMELRLSRSLLTFSRIFSHDGIQAITEPFSHFLFTMKLQLSRSLLTLSFHDGTSAIMKPSHTFLFTMEFRKTHNLGEDSFHIYYNEYLHRIGFVKNLAP
jgi:hypothetical protein